MTAVIHHVETAQQAVALTFDDGPDPTFTPQLLEVLAEVPGSATFYMVGEQILASPEVARAVHGQGHEIGNHTFTHPDLTRLPQAEVEGELRRTDELIRQVTGSRPRTFRPPYLAWNQDVLDVAARMGYSTVGAVNLDARDWERPGTRHIIERTRESVRRGSILLFHDGYGDRSQTVEAVRVLAAELTEQGYRLVTVSELLRMEATREDPASTTEVR